MSQNTRKRKHNDSVLSFQTIATFKDGVWTKETTPLNESGGKKRVLKSHIQGDELVVVICAYNAVRFSFSCFVLLFHLTQLKYVCPQLRRSWRGILVSGCSSFPPSHASIWNMHACHILWTVHASVLEIHTWIPHGKIADPYIFLVRVISRSGVIPFWKNQNETLYSKISRKVSELEVWNLVSW